MRGAAACLLSNRPRVRHPHARFTRGLSLRFWGVWGLSRHRPGIWASGGAKGATAMRSAQQCLAQV
eukprot:221019-Heterocapsa_arctica.AAC.1